MNKKGVEAHTLLESGLIVLAAFLVLFLIYVGIQVGQAFFVSKDAEIKKSFNNLVEDIDSVIVSGKEIIVPIYLTNKYDLVAFDSQGHKSGPYEKPTECGLTYCIVICKKGIVGLIDNCKPPISFKVYEIEILFDKDKPVLIYGIDGIVLVNVTKVDNKISIKQQTTTSDVTKQLYKQGFGG
ncbi:hypothetical protein HYX18_03335 [Candidatus Woesearchaeota archaeon]|nr:hypothetical protein [Candidatus Woesearchaeota archaeon]